MATTRSTRRPYAPGGHEQRRARRAEYGSASGRASCERRRRVDAGRARCDGARRINELIGIPNDEMRMKERYEQALRDGRLVASVPASGDEQKALAARILLGHGARFIDHLGRFTIEALHP